MVSPPKEIPVVNTMNHVYVGQRSPAPGSALRVTTAVPGYDLRKLVIEGLDKQTATVRSAVFTMPDKVTPGGFYAARLGDGAVVPDLFARLVESGITDPTVALLEIGGRPRFVSNIVSETHDLVFVYERFDPIQARAVQVTIHEVPAGGSHATVPIIAPIVLSERASRKPVHIEDAGRYRITCALFHEQVEPGTDPAIRVGAGEIAGSEEADLEILPP